MFFFTLNCFRILSIVSTKYFFWYPNTFVSQGLIAPSEIDLVSSGTILYSSKYFSTPSPSHSEQAPCGALKLNNLGSISSILNPDTGHANFDENMDILFVSRFSKYNKPSYSVNATSILSLNLCWIFFFTTSRSITTSILCLKFFLSEGTSSIS